MSNTAKTYFYDPKGHGSYHELFAYVSIDENGMSGICATQTELGLCPLIGMTRQDVKKWEQVVESMREQTDKFIVLVRYRDAVVIE